MQTLIVILICIFLVAFAIVPLVGGAFLLLSSKIFRIENVTYLRAYLAYLVGYVAASIICSALMFLLLSLSSGQEQTGIIFWTSLPWPQFLLLFVVAIAVHMVVVPLVLNTRYTRAVLAHGLAILMNCVAFGVVGAILLIPAVAAARNAARRTMSMNNMRAIQYAFQIHHDERGSFPAAASYDEQGKPLLSWRVHVLPYLEQQPLYEQFHLDEPWDSPHNKNLLNQMPATYRSPRSDDPEDTTTYYQVFVTRVTFPPPENERRSDPYDARNPPFALLDASIPVQPFFLNSRPGLKNGPRYSSIMDGSENTISIAEAGSPVPWTKPADIDYDPEKPLPELGGGLKDGFLAARFDGSLQFIPADTPEDVIRAAITHNGGEEMYGFPP